MRCGSLWSHSQRKIWLAEWNASKRWRETGERERERWAEESIWMLVPCTFFFSLVCGEISLHGWSVFYAHIVSGDFSEAQTATKTTAKFIRLFYGWNFTSTYHTFNGAFFPQSFLHIQRRQSPKQPKSFISLIINTLLSLGLLTVLVFHSIFLFLCLPLFIPMHSMVTTTFRQVDFSLALSFIRFYICLSNIFAEREAGAENLCV